MNKSNTSKKSSTSKRLILIAGLAILVALIGVVSALYVRGGNPFLASTSPSPQVETTSPTPNPTPSESTAPVTDTSTLKIPELGIQIQNVPGELNDVTYIFNPGQNGIKWVSFNTPEASKVCPEYTIGALTRGEGIYSNNPHIKLDKQLDGFWISITRNQSVCWDNNKQVPKVWESKANALNTLLSDTDNIQALQ